MMRFFRSRTHELEFVYVKDSKLAYPEHNHVSVFTIGMVLEGRFQLKCCNQITCCEKGSFFVVQPYEPHSLEPLDGKYTLLSACIGKHFVEKHDLHTAIGIVLEALSSLHGIHGMQKDHITCFSEALVTLYNRMPLAIEDNKDDMKPIKDMMEQAPEDLLPLDQLAGSAFISKYHFVRTFKKSVGLTPHRFQIQNRIRKAQRLLNIGVSIKEVALTIGFYDQSHFIRYFKHETGLTPTEYVAAQRVLP